MSKGKNKKFIIKRNQECIYAEQIEEEYVIYNPYTKKREYLKPDPFFDIYGNDLRISILHFLERSEANLCLFSLTDGEYQFLLSLIRKVRREIFLNHRKNILNLVRSDRTTILKNPNLGNSIYDLFLFLRNYNLLIARQEETDLTLEMFTHEEEEYLQNITRSYKKESEKELDITMVRARERFNEQKAA